jgi:cytochrome c peroxidase
MFAMQSTLRGFSIVVAGLAAILLLASAPHGPSVIAMPIDAMKELPADLGALTALPDLSDNPATAAKIELGRRLFNDRRLSGDLRVSCATCHIPEKAFTDGRPFSAAAHGKRMPRHTPTVLNAAYYRSWNWDGKFTSIRQHTLATMGNPKNMNLQNESLLIARLELVPAYRTLFHDAFGAGPSRERVAQAIEVYQRTLTTPDSPFDRYARGDKSALTESQKRGLMLFTGKANCTECHYGTNFTDDSFHALGVGGEDPGRAGITGLDMDLKTFKTPTLRNVSLTAPYMHDGSVGTLRDVVDFYDAGGGSGRPKTPLLWKLNLSEREKSDLIAFLRSLTGTPRG